MNPDCISKTERKRQVQSMQELGAQLADCEPSFLQQLQLGTALQKALQEYTRLKSYEAKRRQLQYIGKLMRSENSEQITQLFVRQDMAQRQLSIRTKHLPEVFKDLLQNTSQARNQLFSEYPQVDKQHINNILRQIDKENRQKPYSYPPQGKYQRKLWDILVSLEKSRTEIHKLQ